MLALAAMDTTVAGIFGLVACVCFALAALAVVVPRINLIAAGLFFLAVPFTYNWFAHVVAS